jgi:pimeloyl-ACP methyl ester carboxylesterase
MRAGLVLGAAVLALCCAGCDGSADASRVLFDDLAAFGKPSPLKARAGEVARQSVSGLGDIYHLQGSHRRLVLLKSWGDPINDAAAVNIAQSLARIGFDVLVPSLPNAIVPPKDGSSKLAEILARFGGSDGGAPDYKLVLVALSLSGPSAIQFAMDHPDHVAGLILLGVPVDFMKSLRALAKGEDLRAPNRHLLWQGVAKFAANAVPPRDQGQVSAFALARATGTADIKRPAGLSSTSLAVLDAAEAGELTRLPDGSALAGQLAIPAKPTGVPTLIAYGRDDPLCPPDESAPMAANLQLGTDSVFVFDRLQDLSTGAEPSRRDRAVWLKILSRLLAWRS